jgi:hypothetical protein
MFIESARIIGEHLFAYAQWDVREGRGLKDGSAFAQKLGKDLPVDEPRYSFSRKLKVVSDSSTWPSASNTIIGSLPKVLYGPYHT